VEVWGGGTEPALPGWPAEALAEQQEFLLALHQQGCEETNKAAQ
jgi:hypothetical protein